MKINLNGELVKFNPLLKNIVTVNFENVGKKVINVKNKIRFKFSRIKVMELIDQFSRKINYLRISVTDRCDLRCVYCMKEKMSFLPKNEILTLEEIERLCDNFIEMGVSKIRLTGGEPLVRKDIISLIKNLNLKKKKTGFK